jgi:DNA end-binding protein Ku
MRSLWRGAISFGLVNIPVRLYKASRDRELKFKLLHKKDLSEIRYARICKADGKEVPWDEVVKGYKWEDGDYVILADEDFEKANLKKTRTIDIIDFTEEEDIDTIYYETPYYLEPEKGATKAYVLLREALARSKKVAVGNYVFRQHEHLGVIKPHGDLLLLNQLRYDAEIVSPKKLTIPKKLPIHKNEIDMALDLIDKLTKPFHPEDYKDTYTKEIKAVIAKKAKGRRVTIKSEPVQKTPKVHDIMSMLKASLQEHKKKKTKRRKIA